MVWVWVSGFWSFQMDGGRKEGREGGREGGRDRWMDGWS
jgi:hypothetical protein